MNLTLAQLFALSGVTIIVVRGEVFAWLRKLWPALLGCAMCTGFWVGTLGAIALGVIPWRLGESLVDLVLAGATVALASLLVDAVLLKLLGGPESGDPES